jgi:hypothetical protein
MPTTTRILATSILALALPWAATGVAEARPPKLDLLQYETCMNKPLQNVTNTDGTVRPEKAFEKRRRCCESAGGTLVFSTQGPRNCVQPGAAEGPREVIATLPDAVLSPA